MANNLHISYDLIDPGQNYDRVISAIKQLGSWAKIHYSYWYVDSVLSATQARDALVRALDANDSLYIVDSTNNDAAWHNVPDKVSQQITSHWLARAA